MFSFLCTYVGTAWAQTIKSMPALMINCFLPDDVNGLLVLLDDD